MTACLDFCTERTGNNTYFFSAADAKVTATSSDPFSHLFRYAGFEFKTTPSGIIQNILVVTSKAALESPSKAAAAEAAAALSPSAQLTEIRDWTSMTMAQIADLLGITRQTVYNRLAGSDMNSFSVAQLDQLYLSLKQLSEPERKCFKRVAFSILRDGSSLSKMLQKEDDLERSVTMAFQELSEKMQPLIRKEAPNELDAVSREKVLARLDRTVPKVVYEP